MYPYSRLLWHAEHFWTIFWHHHLDHMNRTQRWKWTNFFLRDYDWFTIEFAESNVPKDHQVHDFSGHLKHLRSACNNDIGANWKEKWATHRKYKCNFNDLTLVTECNLYDHDVIYYYASNLVSHVACVMIASQNWNLVVERSKRISTSARRANHFTVNHTAVLHSWKFLLLLPWKCHGIQLVQFVYRRCRREVPFVLFAFCF